MKRLLSRFPMSAGLILLLQFNTYATAEAGSSQWPVGTNVCQGNWKYKEYDSCESTAHGDDSNRPIYETNGEKCGYTQKEATCAYGNQVSRVVDTAYERNARNDSGYSAEEIAQLCLAKTQTINLEPNGQEWVEPGNISAIRADQGQECRSRDWKKKCQKWTKVLNLQCRIVVSRKIVGPSGSACGYVNDQPRNCVVGYQKVAKRSASCSTFKELTSPINTDATSLKADSWRFDFACSTADELADDTRSNFEHKYSKLLSLLESNIGTQEEEPLKGNLARLAQQAHATEAEKANIEKIVKKSSENLTKAEGVYFSANKDCASTSSGADFFFCTSKRITLDLGDAQKYSDLVNYTSMKFKFNYTFKCPVKRGNVSVNAHFNNTSIMLSPNADGVQQYIELPYSPKDGNLTIDFNTDPDSIVGNDCSFAAKSLDINIDTTLLAITLKKQISHFNELIDTRSSLGNAKQLPAKFSAIKSLKSQISNQMLDDILSCRTVAEKAGKVVEETCPLIDDHAKYCASSPVSDIPELQILLDKLRNNSCLLSDVDSALPASSPCFADSAVECITEVTKIEETINHSIQKNWLELSSIKKYLESHLAKLGERTTSASQILNILLNDLQESLESSTATVHTISAEQPNDIRPMLETKPSTRDKL
ncbi:MAG: hypothetical protein EOP48_07695 [Sphingobacteriales bacterium]|nr:MAG: hypothetical protein EOP48_07695 [Sphingobacteriales bacterium]